MKTIHFHIGSGRCGSTLVQVCFNDGPLRDLLAQFGIHVDMNVYTALNAIAPITGFNEAALKPIRAEHFRPHKVSAHAGYFFTQEAMIGMAFERGVPNFCADMCDALDYLTDGFELRPIIILRRQDGFIESLYNQMLKRGETRDFGTYLDEFPLENLEWDAVCAPFAERFGAGLTSIIPFDRPVLQGAGDDHFIQAMMRALGLPADIRLDADSLPVINASLAPRVREIQRLANQTLASDEALELANWFEKNITKQPGDRHDLMGSERRKALGERFRESNQRYFATYLPDHDPAHYLDDWA